MLIKSEWSRYARQKMSVITSLATAVGDRVIKGVTRRYEIIRRTYVEKAVVRLARLAAHLGLYALASRLLMLCVPRFNGTFHGAAKVVHLYRTRKSPNGGYVGLNTSSDLCVDALRAAGVDAVSIGVPDANGIDRVLFQVRPSHLVIKAFWVPREKLELLARKYPSCKFIVVCHSKPSFLGQEGSGIVRFGEAVELSHKLPNVRPACNNLDTAKAMSVAYDCDVMWVPNVMPSLDITRHGRERQRDTFEFGGRQPLDVGLFCAIRPFKNIMNQALAAIVAAGRLNTGLRLHVIANRAEMDGERTLDNLRRLFRDVTDGRITRDADTQVVLVEHDWSPHDEFLTMIGTQIDVGMQASFTESFNIVTFDFVSAGVPIVTSPAIGWAPSWWGVNPDSVEDMASDIVALRLMSASARHYRNMSGARAIADYNAEALAAWSNILSDSRSW